MRGDAEPPGLTIEGIGTPLGDVLLVAWPDERLCLYMTTANGEMSMAPAGPQTVAAGQTFAFAPGGYHVMVFDLAPELAAGGQTEVTLTVEGGDKTSFMVPIRSAGDER